MTYESAPGQPTLQRATGSLIGLRGSTAIPVIGCDVGTQSVRASVVDDAGAMLASASVGVPIAYPQPGWAEQDPRLWLEGLETVIVRAVEESGVDRDSIAAIGVAAQVDAIVAFDARGDPLPAAPIWMDRRATRETRELVDIVGEARIREITGVNPDSSHGAGKIAWLRRHVDGESFAPPAAFVVEWLTGERVMDAANASSLMLWDVRANTWSSTLLDAAQLQPDDLPSVQLASDVVGPLRRHIAERLNLRADCVVATGTGDEHAAFVGAGALDERIIGDVAGTAEPVGASSAEPIVDGEALLETHCHAVPGRWLIENPGFVSGGSVRWLAEVLGCTQIDVFDLASRAGEGAGGVSFLPALNGSVTPRWVAQARGAFAGLTVGHGRAELARAVLEGCAFAVRDSVDRLQALGLGRDALRVVGGGARVPAWLQIKADVTGLPVEVPRQIEATSLGAAVLAAVAAGVHANADDAARVMVGQPALVVEPRPAFRGLYGDAYQRYRQLFDVLEPTFPTTEAGA